jgi:hypothetical protein
MKTLKDIKAEKGTIKELVLKDAEGDIDYIKDIANNGCQGGGCNGLIYYEDTHNFYNKYAEEIDELLEELNEESGYNVIDNMKRMGQTDLRNFLSWLAYEVNAQNIMTELEE